jgi:hypothetical protein
VLASNQAGEAPLPCYVDTRPPAALTCHPIRPHLLGHALDADQAQVIAVEIPSNQFIGMFGELNGSRCCRLFHTRCQNDRMPDGFVVHTQIVADRADDHWPRVDTYPELDACAAFTLHPSTHARHRLLQG